MRRRVFVRGLCATLAAVPFVGLGQGAKRVGVLTPLPDDAEAQREMSGFREELRRLGWREGDNLIVHYRSTGGDFARVKPLAKEIVALKPDVIMSRTTPASAALLEETRSIPIVFVAVSDPVGDKIVSSLARPRGNVTGFINVEDSLGGKYLELLKEVAPSLAHVGVIFNPKTAPGGGKYHLPLVEKAGAAMGIRVTATPVHDADQTERAINALANQAHAGLVVIPDAANVANRKRIIAAVARHRLPAIYPIPAFIDDGGLMSYGANIADLYRRSAGYIDRILRGAKPADLPVQAPEKFDLTINAKTAQALGIAIPRSLLLRADRVIE